MMLLKNVHLLIQMCARLTAFCNKILSLCFLLSLHFPMKLIRKLCHDLPSKNLPLQNLLSCSTFPILAASPPLPRTVQFGPGLQYLLLLLHESLKPVLFFAQ